MADRDELADAVDSVGSVMKDAVLGGAELVVQDLRAELVEAWASAAEAVADVGSTLRKGGKQLDEHLSQVGLAGKQLNLKLRGLARAVSRWSQRRRAQQLLRVLGWANVFLGSLATVIPGGEVIKEYKESLEQAVKDNQEG